MMTIRNKSSNITIPENFVFPHALMVMLELLLVWILTSQACIPQIQTYTNCIYLFCLDFYSHGCALDWVCECTCLFFILKPVLSLGFFSISVFGNDFASFFSRLLWLIASTKICVAGLKRGYLVGPGKINLTMKPRVSLHYLLSFFPLNLIGACF